MILAIVGSVSLAGDVIAQAHIRAVLEKYNPRVVVSGGAKGIDSMAVSLAEEMGIIGIEIRPFRQSWRYFRERNLMIAQVCDRLVRIADRNSSTYGSGWTRDRAVELGKPTEEIVCGERA